MKEEQYWEIVGKLKDRAEMLKLSHITDVLSKFTMSEQDLKMVDKELTKMEKSREVDNAKLEKTGID